MAFEKFNVICVSLPQEGHDRHMLVDDTVNLLKKCHPIGAMGNYTGVYHINNNSEGFIPLKESCPTMGTKGISEQCAGYFFITYSHENVSEFILETFLANLISIHPWEHPVIFTYPVSLWVP